jgi:hypothetical protein
MTEFGITETWVAGFALFTYSFSGRSSKMPGKESIPS